MPTYEYACTECGERLEAVQSFSDDPLTVCPVCQGKLRKLFSAVGVVFKGSGFYKTDSRSSKSATTPASTASPATNGSGSPSDSGGSSDSSSTSSSSGSDSASTSSTSSGSSSTAGSGSSTGGGSDSTGGGSKVA